MLKEKNILVTLKADNEHKCFAKNLSSILREKKLNAETASARCMIPTQTFQLYLDGAVIPDPQDMQRIENALGVSRAVLTKTPEDPKKRRRKEKQSVTSKKETGHILEYLRSDEKNIKKLEAAYRDLGRVIDIVLDTPGHGRTQTRWITQREERNGYTAKFPVVGGKMSETGAFDTIEQAIEARTQKELEFLKDMGSTLRFLFKRNNSAYIVSASDRDAVICLAETMIDAVSAVTSMWSSEPKKGLDIKIRELERNMSEQGETIFQI